MKDYDTNPFYAILYTYWEFIKSGFLIISKIYVKFWQKVLPCEYQSKSIKDFSIRRNAIACKGGTACYYAVWYMSGTLALKSLLFVFPISQLIINQISDKSLHVYIIAFFCVLVVLPLIFFMDEKYYTKYFILYEKRENSWKLKWKVISFIDFLVSFACVYLGYIISNMVINQ